MSHYTLFNYWIKTNARRFIYSYASKLYEDRRTKKSFSGQILQKQWPCLKRRHAFFVKNTFLCQKYNFWQIWIFNQTIFLNSDVSTETESCVDAASCAAFTFGDFGECTQICDVGSKEALANGCNTGNPDDCGSAG